MSLEFTPETPDRSETAPVSQRGHPRRLGADERGVSEVIGAILLFGILISLLVLIQVNAVPAENQQVEFEHNQRVQQDMLALDDAILDTATMAVPGSSKVELGARYPSRFFLLNPNPGTGTVESTAPAPLRIKNAKGVGIEHYWDGDRSFTTQFVRYRPGYNEYANAPVTLLEHGTVVNTFDTGAAVPVDAGAFVQGNQITLVTVDGRFSEASSTSTTVETTPLSAPTQSVLLTSDGTGDIVLELPTTLPEDHWDDAFAEQLATGAVADVRVVSDAAFAPYEKLVVELGAGTYETRIARVGVRGSFDRSTLGAHYLAAASDTTTESVFQAESVRLRAQVRDRYNNPADGEVTYTTSDGQFLRVGESPATEVTVSTDEDGLTGVRFTPDSSLTGTATVTATLGPDGTGLPREQVTFEVPVLDESALAGDDDSTSSINPVDPGTVQLDSVTRSKETVTVALRNTGSETRRVDELRIPFYNAGSSGKSADYATVNGEATVVANVGGAWVSPADPVDIIGGDRVSITFEFNDLAEAKGFMGLSVRYDEGSENYYIQVPKK